jgi:hypothetical protein
MTTTTEMNGHAIDEPPAPPQTLVDALLERMTPEERARYDRAQPYGHGDLHKLHESGEIEMRPYGLRVLMRAILAEDASGLGAGVQYDSRRAVAHEIVAIGTAVERYLDKHGWPDDARDKRTLWERVRAFASLRGSVVGARPRPGDHVYVLSTAADRASKTDRTCRLWLAHIDDVSSGWNV